MDIGTNELGQKLNSICHLFINGGSRVTEATNVPQ